MHSAAVIVAALLAMLLGPAPAYAQDSSAGFANFLRQGSRVYEVDDVGRSCRWFGNCDGAASALNRDATPQYLSLRPGEGVGVSCTLPGLVKVHGFFNGSEEQVDGWAYPADLRLRGALPEC